ncbi:Methionine--tRNA ligase [Trichinella spiralis]|uniref:Methionine--tRNA ligase n=1 Tax=Trichinella spiralis TaxID=6334 RepID=A0ABR3L1I8_TRISP
MIVLCCRHRRLFPALVNGDFILLFSGKIDASQLSHGFVEKLTSVVPQPPHPLTNTALTGKPRFSLALQNSPYSQ